MKTSKIFRYLLVAALLQGSATNVIAQDFVVTTPGGAKFTAGNTTGSNVWYWDGDADYGSRNMNNRQNDMNSPANSENHGFYAVQPNYSKISVAKANRANLRYRVMMQNITYAITLPSYSTRKCEYSFKGRINDPNNVSTYRGIELFDWGSEKSYSENQELNTSANTSSKSNPYRGSLVFSDRHYGNNTVEATGSCTWNLNNTTASEKTCCEYLAMHVFGRRSGNKGYEAWIEVTSEKLSAISYINQIQYDLAGGNGVPNSGWATSNTVTNLVPTKAGYAFLGWKDENGAFVAKGETYTATSTNKGPIKLTAQWINTAKTGEGGVWERYVSTIDDLSEICHYSLNDAFNHRNSDKSKTWNFAKDGCNPSMSYLWKPQDLTNRTISSNRGGNVGDVECREFASFTTEHDNRFRIVAQKISLKVNIPKYSQVKYNYTLAGEVRRTNSNTDYYGFELVDFGTESDLKSKYGQEINPSAKVTSLIHSEVNWLVNNSDEKISSVGNWQNVGNIPCTLLRNGCSGNALYVGDKYTPTGWEYTSNFNKPSATSITRYFAVMAYFQKANATTATASFGYKGEPEYEYYTSVTYHANDGTGSLDPQNDMHTSDKSGSFKLRTNNSISREGYAFVGWSTDPNATEAMYKDGADFYPYDSEDGGGKGPQDLYAIWVSNTVTLDPCGGTPTQTVTATLNQKFPTTTYDGEQLVIPTREGHVFCGFYDKEGGEGTQYYDWDMNPTNNVWTPTSTDAKLYASWTLVNIAAIYDNTIPNCGDIVGNNKYVGVTVSRQNSLYGYEGDGYISDRHGHYLTDNITDNHSSQIKPSVDRDNAVLWTIARDIESGKYLIFSKNKKKYFGIYDNRYPVFVDSPNEAHCDCYWNINAFGQVYQIPSGTGAEEGYVNVISTTGEGFWQREKYETIELRKNDIRKLLTIGIVSSYKDATMSSDEIISVIRRRFEDNQWKDAFTPGSSADWSKGILYVDLGALHKVENPNTWNQFQAQCADNALLYLPNANADDASSFFSKNVCYNREPNPDAQKTLVSAKDFVLTDMKPFFSLYTFNTDQKNAVYERALSASSASQSTIVLPFSFQYNQWVFGNELQFGTVGQITEKEDGQNFYKEIQVTTYNGNMISANQAYHIKASNNKINIRLNNVEVAETAVKEYVSTNGDWTAYGNYFGLKFPEGEKDRYYYGSGYYWCTSTLNKPFNAMPFRAYFTTSDAGTKPLRVVFVDEDADGTSTGIYNVEDKKSSNDIYTISGMKVNGKPKQHGIYIVNGKKIMF